MFAYSFCANCRKTQVLEENLRTDMLSEQDMRAAEIRRILRLGVMEPEE